MGAFKLGKMTFGSLFKKPETVLYPIESKPQPAGLKGHIAIDAPSCILCGMCERSCSTDCIAVDKARREWRIDRLQCVQCGYCITVCPKKCLSMDPNYAPATTVHAADAISIPEQPKPEKAAVKAEKPAAEPAPENAAPQAQEQAETDAQVEALISIMDPVKAAKVRSALDARL